MSQLHEELQRQRSRFGEGVVAPPLGQLRTRSRRRQRRSMLASIATTGCLLVAVLAWLPGQRPGSLDSAAPSGEQETRYKVSLAVASDVEAAGRRRALEACLGSRGLDVDRQGPDEFLVVARDADAGRTFEGCARSLKLYRIHLASRPSTGSSTRSEMDQLAADITADGEALAAQDVKLVHWGPDESRGLVVVAVAESLVRADAVLHDRFGDAILVVLSEPAGRR